MLAAWATIPTTDLYFANAMATWIARPFRRGPIVRLGANSFAAGELAVVCRRDRDDVVEAILARRGGRLVYVIDDDLWAAEHDPHLPEDYRSRLVALRDGQHRRLVDRADQVAVSSEALARRYAGIAPTVRLDPHWSDPLADGAHVAGLSAGAPLRVGYLGTASHGADRAFAMDVIARLLAREERATAVLFGRADLPGWLASHPRVRVLPTRSWPWHRRRLRGLRLHFALYPALGGAFNAARSVNKLIEHAVVGAAGVYSSGWEHARLVSATGAGLVVDADPDAWADAMLEAAAGQQRLSALHERARSLAERINDPARQTSFWADRIPGIAGRPPLEWKRTHMLNTPNGPGRHQEGPGQAGAMDQVPGSRALEVATASKPNHRFPPRDDPRYQSNGLFPSVKPSFQLSPGSRVFTIGSCFARNVEEVLDGFDLPTTRFAVPTTEWKGRPNGLLNEYNPGCMAQRIDWAVAGADTGDLTTTLVGPDDQTVDLFLAVGEPVTRERAIARRREIDGIYRQLFGSEALILTLGLVECWFDTESGHYLNRMPPPPMVRRDRGRFVFRRLTADDCAGLLEPALDRLIGAGVNRILLTVSPVPLQTTFTGEDAVIANSYSKATLRITADRLVRRFAGQVDYFPSYEIVTSSGLSAFGDDNVHVRPVVVKRVIDYMKSVYVA